jgi:hypothetical protein
MDELMVNNLQALAGISQALCKCLVLESRPGVPPAHVAEVRAVMLTNLDNLAKVQKQLAGPLKLLSARLLDWFERNQVNDGKAGR